MKPIENSGLIRSKHATRGDCFFFFFFIKFRLLRPIPRPSENYTSLSLMAPGGGVGGGAEGLTKGRLLPNASRKRVRQSPAGCNCT